MLNGNYKKQQMKKTILILIIIFIVIAIGVGVYFGYKKSSSVITPNQNQQSGSLPVSSSGSNQNYPSNNLSNLSSASNQTDTTTQSIYDQQKQKLSLLTNNDNIFDYWIYHSTSTSSSSASVSERVFYINNKGEVSEITGPLQEKIISTSNYGVPLKLVQSIDGRYVAIQFNSGSLVLFDSSTGIWKELSSGVSSFDFSPDGKKIAILKYSGGIANIYSFNLLATKNQITLLSSLNILDSNILWPDTNKIFMMPKQSSNYSGQIWYLDLNKKTINLFDQGQGIGAIFSYPFDYAMKFISTDSKNYAVSLTNKSGTKLSDIVLSTIPEKCSFSYDSKFAYCALSFSNSKGSDLVLPDDYLMNGAYFNDGLYQVDLQSYEVSTLFNAPNENLDISDIKESGGQLYFVNRLDGQLYVFNLN